MSKMNGDCAQKVVDAYENLPSFGQPIDSRLRSYVDELGWWVSRNLNPTLG